MKDEFDRWARFFSRNVSEEEREEIQRWIDSSLAHKEYAAEMRELWDSLSARRPTTQSRNADASWNAVLDRAREKKVQPRRVKERPPVRRAKRNPVFKSAIILSALLIPALLFVLLREASQQNEQIITYASERGERLGIRLNDGSMAYLSVDSKLLVPEKFTEEIRELELEGEAYFDVVSDENRPFVVHAGAATVRVLGTEFNLRSYNSEEEVALLVTEGRVSFSKRSEENVQGSLVRAGQQSRYTEGQAIQVRDYKDTDEVLSWREGKLIFIDKTLKEITDELERWYATEFSFQEEHLSQISITAVFSLKDNEPLGNVLDIIEKTAEVECNRGEETVVISR